MSAKVSTVIPAYNSERTIAEAIDSVLAQQYDDHEIIVVDDGSTDATPGILARYGDAIRVITQKNGGLSVARNAGIRQSKGKYLAFLDSDDIWLPGKLARLTAMLDANPRASLAFSEYGLIDASGAEYGRSSIGEESWMRGSTESPFPIFSLGSPILPSTWLVPREVLSCIGGFSEAFTGAGGYDDFWILLLLRERGEFIHVPEKLALYRTADVTDKYALGVSVFIGLVKRRYGPRGKHIIRTVKNKQCRTLLVKAAHQMNDRNRLGVLHSLLRIAKLRPSYFFSRECIGRLRLPQNTQRLRDLAVSRKRASEQSEGVSR